MSATSPPTPDPSASSATLPRASYRRLGTSGLRVSVPILGCMGLGDSRWQPWVLDSDAALPLLKAAYDRGITTWDTANVYSNGESERVIGRAIAKYGLPREQLVLMTKICGTVRPSNEPDVLALSSKDLDNSRDVVNQRGLSRAAIFAALDASLERLGTGYVDVLQIHRFDPNTPIEETMEALHDLVRGGKVRYVGASSMWTYQFAMMQGVARERGWRGFVSMQNFYCALYREEEREMNKYCKETGVGLIPWSPLGGGALARPRSKTTTGEATADKATSTSNTTDEATTKSIRSTNNPFASVFADEHSQEIIKRVEEIAEQKGWTMAQVSLAWLLEKGVSSPIVGLGSVERMDEALTMGGEGKRLSEEEVGRIDEPYRARSVVGH